MSTDTTTFDRGYNLLTLDRPYEASGEPTETAVYKFDTATGNWNFVACEPGDANASRGVLNTVGLPMLSTTRIVHLRKGGQWMQVVPDHLMQPSTPRQGIETEIADLRAEAHRISEQAAYSGSWGSGAGMLEARADAMQHVLDVLATDND